MSELYLVAHKVRGEPAFDVAERMVCPNCGGLDALYEAMYAKDCPECDGEGFWWIIPTSGHRAYPYWDIPLGALLHDCKEATLVRTIDECGSMPVPWPDHYAVNNPSHKLINTQLDLLTKLNLLPKLPPIRRL